MGMFDTVVLEEPARCPRCGAPLRDFQTKAFECVLGVHRVGDAMPLRICDGAFEVHTSCGDYQGEAGCGGWIMAKAHVVNGVLTRVDSVSFDEADLRDASRELRRANKELFETRDRLRALEEHLAEIQRQRIGVADLAFLQENDIPRAQVVAVGRLHSLEFSKFDRRSGRWVRYVELTLRTPSGASFSLAPDAPIALLVGSRAPKDDELLGAGDAAGADDE